MLVKRAGRDLQRPGRCGAPCRGTRRDRPRGRRPRCGRSRLRRAARRGVDVVEAGEGGGRLVARSGWRGRPGGSVWSNARSTSRVVEAEALQGGRARSGSCAGRHRPALDEELRRGVAFDDDVEVHQAELHIARVCAYGQHAEGPRVCLAEVAEAEQPEAGGQVLQRRTDASSARQSRSGRQSEIPTSRRPATTLPSSCWNVSETPIAAAKTPAGAIHQQLKTSSEDSTPAGPASPSAVEHWVSPRAL